MNEALIQNTEDDIDGDDSRGNQVRLRGQGRFKNLGGPLIDTRERRRLGERPFRVLNSYEGVAQRMSWCEVEGQCHGGKLILVVDSEWGHRHVRFRQR